MSEKHPETYLKIISTKLWNIIVTVRKQQKIELELHQIMQRETKAGFFRIVVRMVLTLKLLNHIAEVGESVHKGFSVSLKGPGLRL